MKFFSSITLASSFAQALAFPLTSRQANAPYFVLTGDSTTAVDGGWGDGFLALLTGGADGVNLGESGATTRSFVAEGFWGQAIDAVEANRDAYDPIVTIQFGHNDQKAESGVTLEMFKTNLLGFIGDVQAAGGTPIIITSLTRRTFSGGAVVENLVNERRIAIEAAEESGVLYLDLNRASTDYINAIGSVNADYYNWGPGDRTHLNPAGTTVFGRLVADLLLEERADLDAYLTKNQELSDKLSAGEFATGDE
ncbi:hypothetical protein S40285_05761 [Stachybotrys chlorohalonatus IBT 40285]|uniref:SGNH hydrolase-type esterase domain-containing protein n=1 Tax=Stachybotrys chlorohalonatus (strain IBT 40285) TaxID=1283841 RepID=A0A084QSK4_STAC4|nr:hypothetical protein S40285_05761 [Stachybotrys chlorohalonata IBT 40285]